MDWSLLIFDFGTWHALFENLEGDKFRTGIIKNMLVTPGQMMKFADHEEFKSDKDVPMYK